jgi:HEAT repeat protein
VWHCCAVAPDITPRERIAAERARRGKEAVLADCLAVLRGEPVTPELLTGLAGRGVEKFFDGEEHGDTYWFRVWALRALLWSWDPRAADAVIEAMEDDSWRVREMAAKVVARNLVGDAVSAVSELGDDPVPRVRAAAARALVRLSEADA